MNAPYSALAACYDRLNAHVDYGKWADFLVRMFRKYAVPEKGLVLDLGCGTGNVTLPLARRGYETVGIDLSPDMLAAARNKPGGERVLWLCQDMRSFRFPEKADAAVCCLDSINYLTDRAGLGKFLTLVQEALRPGGLFIFDINTLYKFRNVYGDRHYILKEDGIYCGWENHFDEKAGLCDFELSFFLEKNGVYHRYDELHRERYWDPDYLVAELEKRGFQILCDFADTDESRWEETSERRFFVTCLGEATPTGRSLRQKRARKSARS